MPSAIREPRHSIGARNGTEKGNGQRGVQFYLLIWAACMLMLSFLQMFDSPESDSDGFTHASNVGGLHLDEAIRFLDVQLPRSHVKQRVNFSLEIFSAPKPFVGPDKEINLRAIRSWLRLEPKPQVTLLGHETGYNEVVKEFDLYSHRHIDRTFLGVPLFNSMFHVANCSTATVAVIINGDIILLQDFVHALERVLNRFQDFLLVGARYDIDRLPMNIAENDPEFNDKVRNYALTNGVLHTYGGMDFWAWNPAGVKLFDPVMPHFIFGRGKYDNWLTHETISAGRRHVIDASEACMSIHVRHGYKLVTFDDRHGRAILGNAEPAKFWSEGKKSKFELFVNIYLSLQIGSYKNQMGSVLFAPWRLSRCLEQSGTCFVRRERPGICNCEYSSSSAATQTDPITKEGSRVIRCGAISKEAKENFAIPVAPVAAGVEPTSFGMPLTLQSVTEKVIIDNTVIVTALNFGYRHILMNWVCNLRQLEVTNFVIAALDPSLYEHAFVRGLPTYFENTIHGGYNASLTDASYGTDAFKHLTKMKSRVVLRFLQLGYDTLWSDADVIWFRNPIRNMQEYHADLVIQTNAPDDEVMNGRRRLNSGFYLARSNVLTIRAFKDVIEYASKSRMSEQPCFYDVICGKQGQNAVGENKCKYKGMSLQLLDRNKYPNGVTGGIWDTEAGMIPQRFSYLFILHNNWVKGAKAKQERLERQHFVMHDVSTGLCNYSRSF